MELYFLRHAIAAERGEVEVAHDSERPLTDDGIERMRKAAQGMKRLGLAFDRVVSSPYLRAKQTAEIVVETLGHKGKLRFHEALTPEASFKDFSRLAREFGAEERVLVVGHQPTLGTFIAELVCGQGNGAIEMKKGALCLVEFLPGASHGVLKWLLPSKLLRSYA